MKAYSISVETLFWRFNLMIALVVIPFVLGVPILALLSGPVFLSNLLGVSFKKEKKESTKQKETVVYPNLSPRTGFARAS